MDFFVECYGWFIGKEGQTGKVGFNHTIERRCNGEFKDYPNWAVYVREEDKGIEMRPELAYSINQSLTMKMDFLSFPEEDRRD